MPSLVRATVAGVAALAEDAACAPPAFFFAMVPG